ncbi:MAG: transporter, family, multidrug resistance protein [Gemmatimonadales bacterium]|jgi:MFS family permease|nr:transporter, family, multidrug resistance protein [Gemmatimonadales bacterium]
MKRNSADSRDQFRRLAVLIAVNFVDMIGFMIVLPLLPFYALKLQATPETIGRLIASFSIAQLLAAPIWGRVSDRYGRRPALLIGLSASAMAYVVFGLATSVWLLFLSRLVQGAGGGTTGVAQAYVADTVEPADRARALGWLSAATSAGVMVGPAIGSFAAHFGQAAPGMIAAALCLINVFFAWKWLPESHKEPAPVSPKGRKPIWHPAWMALRHPTTAIGRLLWIYGVGMLAFASMTSVLALYLGAEFSINETTIGYVFLYVGVLSFVMRSLLLGPIVDRIGETWAMRIGTVLLVVGLALYPLPRDLWTLALIIPLVPIGTALLFPATTSLMSRYSDPGELGTTMGVAQTFAGLARVMAPVLATIAFQRLGHGWPFYGAGILVGLVGIMAFQVEVQPRVAKRAAEGAEA